MEKLLEEWKPVVSYEGLYEVSNLGTVRSLPRMTIGRWGKPKLSPGRIMKPHVMKLGYRRVDLSKDGVAKHALVHRLVAEAFIERVDGKDNINHLDNNRGNNIATNLEWCTHKENTQHARKQGRLGAKNYPNALKTHCINGHPFSEENTYLHNNKRYCKTCRNSSVRNYQRKKVGL